MLLGISRGPDSVSASSKLFVTKDSRCHISPRLLQVREKKRAEIKKLQDDFKALLQSVDPPITVDSEWEDVKEGLVGKPTFDSMPRNDRYDAFKVCTQFTAISTFS